MAHDVFIDIETAGSDPQSAILSIGAVLFDPDSEPDSWLLDPDFSEPIVYYERVDLQSCLDAGLTLNAETMNWWMDQPYPVRHEALVAKPRSHVNVALLNFRHWLNRHGIWRKEPNRKRRGVWANPSHFDIVLLEAAYRKVDLAAAIPWHPGDVVDFKTTWRNAGFDRAEMTFPADGRLHDPRHDACSHAHDAQRALTRLRKWRALEGSRS